MTRDTRRHFGKRVTFVMVRLEQLMYLTHESMEMDTAFALVGNRIKEAVHQETFATPNAAPEPHTAWQLGTDKQLAQTVAPGGFQRQQFIVEFLQPLCGGKLCGIGNNATLV